MYIYKQLYCERNSYAELLYRNDYYVQEYATHIRYNENNLLTQYVNM